MSILPPRDLLTCEILRSEFGAVARALGAALASLGDLTRAELVTETCLLPRVVSEGLLCGVQHGWILPSRLDLGPAVRYRLDRTAALSRLRYARFQMVARSRFGIAGEAIVVTLQLLGACRGPDLIAAARAGTTPPVELACLARELAAMQHAGFVMATPEEPAPVAKKRTRATAPTPPEIAPEVALLAFGSATRTCAEGMAPPGQAPRPQIVVPTRDDAIYRLRPLRFARELLRDAIVAHVAGSVDAYAGAVWDAIFAITADAWGRAAAATHEAVAAWLRVQRPAAAAFLLPDRLDIYLRLLSTAAVGAHGAIVIAASAPRTAASYTVDLACATATLRRAAIEDAVRDTLSAECARVFRLLAAIGPCDQKTVAEHALLPVKQARDALYRLLLKHYIALQAGPQGVHLWKLVWEHAAAQVLETCYKTLLNLRLGTGAPRSREDAIIAIDQLVLAVEGE